MPMRLATVQAYVKDVRTLLLDKRMPPRYSDDDIVRALNMALLEARRLRADLFVTRWGNDVPSFDGVSGEPVPLEAQFRLGLMHGIAWQVLERDDEDVQDVRANAFMNIFHSMMVGQTPAPLQGGTPGPGSAQR